MRQGKTLRCLLFPRNVRASSSLALTCCFYFLSVSCNIFKNIVGDMFVPLKHRELAQRTLAPSLEVHYKLNRKQKKILQKLLLVIKKWAGIQF